MQQYERAQILGTNHITRESGRATLRAKYLGNSKRITVSRYESNTYGQDPQKVTVSWDSNLDIHENYLNAVNTYLERAEWDGVYVVSLITDGAVAVYTGQVQA